MAEIESEKALLAFGRKVLPHTKSEERCDDKGSASANDTNPTSPILLFLKSRLLKDWA